MDRNVELKKLESHREWDIVVIGGGASGLGTALDAASRGYRTLLVEAHDFAKGTSSRSTKLVHGGVRYLGQGNIKLVREALNERGLLAQNANHLVRKQAFVIPHYSWWEGFYYHTGLSIYESLSGKRSFGKTSRLSRNDSIDKLPTLKIDKLKGGIRYYDGQFDDARLAIDLAQTIVSQGGCAINYMRAVALLKDNDKKIRGVALEDQLNGEQLEIESKVVINATGVFANDILKLDRPKGRSMITASQGIHLVLDQSFLNSDTAIMIPKTSDGRVLFVIPWQRHTLIGTTDTPLSEINSEPRALKKEIDFVLRTAGKYLSKRPQPKDVKSVFAGLRPLVRPEGNNQKTKEISRGHKVVVADSGLISVIGGKWTTYRKMAKDTVDKAIRVHGLAFRICVTEKLSIHGSSNEESVNYDTHLDIYGSSKKNIEAIHHERPFYGELLHPNHPYTIAEVIWAIRYEMAETVEDVLARRIRLLFLDAQGAIQCAAKVAKLLCQEKGHHEKWAKEQIKQFERLAEGYLVVVDN